MLITDTKTIKINRLKKVLRCSRCKPNKGENIKRNCKYWKKHQSWKIKNKIEKQYENNRTLK